MIRMETAEDREGWLQLRKGKITGTSASAIVGLNPYMDNASCWELLTGRREAADLGGNELVEYGRKAEEHLRALFTLDFPEYEVLHADNAIVTNDAYPWAAASLDGELLDKSDGRLGILEIKTATISSYRQKMKWEDGIPDNYYTQVLHYMAVRDAEFAIVTAQLKHGRDGEIVKTTRHYRIERKEVQEDIDYLMQEEEKFWRNYLLTDTRPPLKLIF